MTEYTCGFAFDKCDKSVALIVKNRPEWQRGMLNGIGGHIEPGETPVEAQIREFYEETGWLTSEPEWSLFCVLTVPGFAKVYMFRATLPDLTRLKTTTDEKVSIQSTDEGCYTVPNLKWLIPMARMKPEKPYLVSEQVPGGLSNG